jgi:hypothetical protein
MSSAEEFLQLFRGNPAAHCTFDTLTKSYVTLDGGITLADVERHLRGEQPGLLSIPILPTGLCHFAAGDCDRHAEADIAIDHPEVARKIDEMHLPLVITKSKSPKSAHVWLFFADTDGFTAIDARRLIEKYMRVLGIGGEIEIFPKQVELKTDADGKMAIGNGINLPYFSQTRIAYGRDGEELSLEQFLTLAREKAGFGCVLVSRELGDGPSRPGASSADEQDHPMLAATAKRIHTENLAALAASNEEGHWNDCINKAAFFAGRIFGNKKLDVTEDSLKNEIRAAAKARTGYNERQMNTTLDSGWDSGILQPLKIIEDLFPERTATLKEFNEKYFVVTQFGGKCRVCWEEINPKTRALILEDQDFAEFTKGYIHELIEVGSETRSIGRKNKETVEVPEYKNKAEFWLHSPERRQYRRVRFAPNETLPPDIKNLWRGFQVEARQGKIPRFLEHVFENICKAKQDRYDWLMRWEAWKARHPGLQNGTCPVLIGPEGIGKNVAIDAFAYLFGPHCFVATKPEHVTGHFNAHMRACCLLIGNEALYAGNKRDSAVLKGLITDDVVVVEGKGVNAVMEENRVSVILISNEPWSVPAGIGARRFSVFDVSAKHKEDFDYFNAIALELGGARGTLPGYRALLYHLLHEVELKDFRPQQIILTDALVGQQAQSLRGAEALWHSVLFRGELPGGLPGNLVQSERLLKWASLQREKKYDGITDRQLGQLLGENTIGDQRGMGFKHVEPRPVIDFKRIRAWKIPSLRQARQRWDELRFVEKWPELTELNPMVLQDAPDPDDWQYVKVGDEVQPLSTAADEAVRRAIGKHGLEDSREKPAPEADVEVDEEVDVTDKDIPF